MWHILQRVFPLWTLWRKRTFERPNWLNDCAWGTEISEKLASCERKNLSRLLKYRLICYNWNQNTQRTWTSNVYSLRSPNSAPDLQPTGEEPVRSAQETFENLKQKFNRWKGHRTAPYKFPCWKHCRTFRWMDFLQGCTVVRMRLKPGHRISD